MVVYKCDENIEFYGFGKENLIAIIAAIDGVCMLVFLFFMQRLYSID